MASRTGTFYLAQDLSLDLRVAAGQSATIILTRTGSGAFAVGLYERTTGTTYQRLASYAADTAGAVVVNDKATDRYFRLVCDSVTQGETIAYSLADTTADSIPGYKVVNAAGTTLFDVTDDGVVASKVTAPVTGDVTGNVTGNLTGNATGAHAGSLNMTTAAQIGAIAGSLTTLTTIPDTYLTTITLAARQLAVTDALAYVGTKIFDFPLGRIRVLSASGSLQFGIVTDVVTTINASADMDWSLGSVTASSVTLATTMVDLIPKVDAPLAATVTTLNTATTGILAASATFDGTATAIDAFLNVAFPTDTEIDGDGTLAITGTIYIVWQQWGPI